MSQLIQPPEIPAIISPVTNQYSNGTPPVSVTTTACVPSPVCEQPIQNTEVPAALTSEKTLEPEYSSLLKMDKSAALLGPRISVGYFVQPKSGAQPNLDNSTFIVRFV